MEVVRNSCSDVKESDRNGRVFFFLSHLDFPFCSFRFRVCSVFYVMFYVLCVAAFHRRS